MYRFFAIFLLLIASFSCKKSNQEQNTQNNFLQLSDPDKRKPENALKGIDVIDQDLELTLFASEPMMTNPTNMDIDEKGRVWICEAYNYRPELNPNNPYKKTGDRILIMEDTDGDGKADKSKVFYQGEDINAALGIAVLGNKAIVSCSPKIYVFTDTNGDDVADKKEVLFEGIGGFQHDHGVHAAIFGPDGKLYFNYGNEGKGMLSSNGKPFLDDLGRVIKTGNYPYRDGMVYRCQPDGSELEILAWNFRNNYELAVDSYGRMWQSDNDDDGNRGTRINYVMDYGNYGYKDEMTGDSWQVRRTNMEDSIPLRHWHLNDPGVVPNLLQTFAGSPSGILYYEGKLLPTFQNMMIHCEPGHNVVRAYPTTKKGAGFEAKIINMVDGSTKDNWFRPADLAVAPDGSLFIADWYDAGVGGHSMVDTLRGRIYRLAPKGMKYQIRKAKFDSPESCLEALQNPNLATRYLAWTKLHEMQKGAENALLSLYESNDSALRARALWLLGKIKGEENKYIQLASADKDEDIRVVAVRLANETKSFEIIPLLEKLANDPSAQVRREVAFALRHKKSPEAAIVWVTLANKYQGNDRWYLEALGIAADNQWDSFMDEWLKANPDWKTNAAKRDIVWRSRAKENLNNLAELILQSKTNEKLRYYRAFDFIDNPKKNTILLNLIEKDSELNSKLVAFKHINKKQQLDIKRYQANLDAVINKIENPYDYLDIVLANQMTNQLEKVFEMALNSKDEKAKYYAAQVLVKLDGINRLKKIISNKDVEKSVKSIYSYGAVDTKIVTDYLVKILTDTKYDIKIREAATNAMGGWESEEVLWQLMKSDKLPKDVLPIAIKMMLGTWHSDIRALAMKKYANTSSTSNLNIAELLKKKGNVADGQKVFETYCITCHLGKGKGVNFGPALTQIGDKLSKEGLYEAILNPNKGVNFGFETQEITLKDGTVLMGIITSKSENTIQVKTPGSSEAVAYDRKQIKSIKEQKDSLMPQMPLQEKEIIDLVEYLQTLRK